MANPAAGTAYGPMVVTAIEQSYPPDRRVIDDKLAARFLPSAVQVFLAATRLPSVRKLFFRFSESRGRGVWAGVLCRKRYIDDKLSEAVCTGIQVVVNLGAGLDTRAYRALLPEGIPVFEVDLPENIAYKRRKLIEVFDRIPDCAVLLPLDFDHEDLGSRLEAQGFPAGCRAFYIWEAVTQYLSEEGVRKTMGFLSKAGRGSRLVFTYIRKDLLDGTNAFGMELMRKAYCGENPIWRFGLAPEEVGAFLESYGWKEVEQLGGAEFASRYLAPLGREMPVMEIERMALAEKA